MTHEQFTQIYLPFSGKMYALAYNLLRNRDEARDCGHDCFSPVHPHKKTAAIRKGAANATPFLSLIGGGRSSRLAGGRSALASVGDPDKMGPSLNTFTKQNQQP